eukprot:354275-Chlamydomonas_euryale.AAC.5
MPASASASPRPRTCMHVNAQGQRPRGMYVHACPRSQAGLGLGRHDRPRPAASHMVCARTSLPRFHARINVRGPSCIYCMHACTACRSGRARQASPPLGLCGAARQLPASWWILQRWRGVVAGQRRALAGATPGQRTALAGGTPGRMASHAEVTVAVGRRWDRQLRTVNDYVGLLEHLRVARPYDLRVLEASLVAVERSRVRPDLNHLALVADGRLSCGGGHALKEAVATRPATAAEEGRGSRAEQMSFQQPSRKRSSEHVAAGGRAEEASSDALFVLFAAAARLLQVWNAQLAWAPLGSCSTGSRSRVVPGAPAVANTDRPASKLLSAHGARSDALRPRAWRNRG